MKKKPHAKMWKKWSILHNYCNKAKSHKGACTIMETSLFGTYISLNPPSGFMI